MKGTRFFDGKRLAVIEMVDYGKNGCEFSADFFAVGGLKYDADFSAYRVDDIDYLTEQAHDWACLIGDFCDDCGKPEDRFVAVYPECYVTDGDGDVLRTFEGEAAAIQYACNHLHERPIIFGEDGEMVFNW